MTIETGLLVSILAVTIAFFTYKLNKTKANNEDSERVKEEGKQSAVISAKLDNIERGVETIRIDIKANEKRLNDLSEKHVRLEESLKSAHRRIDKLEEK